MDLLIRNIPIMKGGVVFLIIKLFSKAKLAVCYIYNLYIITYNEQLKLLKNLKISRDLSKYKFKTDKSAFNEYLHFTINSNLT